MSDWRKFGATNDADTCLWCGRKLRQTTGVWIKKDGKDVFDPDKPRKKKGGYADGFFCGLRCGYSWAVAWAKLGKSFEPFAARRDS